MLMPRIIYWPTVDSYILDDGHYLSENYHWPTGADFRGEFGRLWSMLFLKPPILPRLAGGIEIVARIGVKQYGFVVVSPEVWSKERGYECRSFDESLPGDVPFYTSDMWDIRFPREPLLGLRAPYYPNASRRIGGVAEREAYMRWAANAEHPGHGPLDPLMGRTTLPLPASPPPERLSP